MSARASRPRQENRIYRSYLGMGYYDCITPLVIQRNILKIPAGTQYTPYQAEIAQGRLEALVNFQTMVADSTGLPLANASLLDEATAAAEAMAMCGNRPGDGTGEEGILRLKDCHPQTIAVLQTRAEPLDVTLHVGRTTTINFDNPRLSGMLLQYPTTDGYVGDYQALVQQAHKAGVLVVVATDLLALTLLRPPGKFGADIAVGSSQRFGVPMGFGGPHAAFLAAKEEYKRQMPGRIAGVSRTAAGRWPIGYPSKPASSTSEGKRRRATFTAQVLLTIIAGIYAVYHGPDSLRRVAERFIAWRLYLPQACNNSVLISESGILRYHPRASDEDAVVEQILVRADDQGLNLRRHEDDSLGVSPDETTEEGDVRRLLEVFVGHQRLPFTIQELSQTVRTAYPANLARTTPILPRSVQSVSCRA